MNIKIVITGSFGYKDIGDEAMLSEDLAYVKNNLKIPNSQIYIFGFNPEYISEYHNHPRENCFSCKELRKNWSAYQQKEKEKKIPRDLKYWLKFFKRKYLGPIVKIDENLEVFNIIKTSDIALITGGGTINTRDSNGYSINRMHEIVSYFKLFNLPVFISGQTIGPLGLYENHDVMAKNIIEYADILTVRDFNYSSKYLDIIGASPSKLLETFDDAYCLPYEDEKLPDNLEHWFYDKDIIAINVTEYTSDTVDKRIFIAELIEYLLVKKYSSRIVLVSHVPVDYYYLCIIQDMLSNDIKNKVILPDTRLWMDRLLKKMISSCKLAIGGRYHFIVFSATSNTRFIGMCGNHYSYIKQDGFARALGLEDYILTEKETWNMDHIIDRVKKVIEIKFDLKNNFTRPSDSMKLLENWIYSKK